MKKVEKARIIRKGLNALFLERIDNISFPSDIFESLESLQGEFPSLSFKLDGKVITATRGIFH